MHDYTQLALINKSITSRWNSIRCEFESWYVYKVGTV